MVRFKHRYMTVEITQNDKEDKPLLIKKNALTVAILTKIKKLYGEFGLASLGSGFHAQYCNVNTRIALIKCRHGPHNFLMKAVPMINDIDGRFVTVKVLYVGATMKKSFLFIKKHQKMKLELMWSSLKNDQEQQKMIDALMTLKSGIKESK